MSSNRIICVTGPESSGKTTLAESVAHMLNAPLVPEVARRMLSPGQGYDAEDVERIAFAQAALEAQALSSDSKWVVLDTDLLVIRIWMQERFGGWSDALEALFDAQTPRLYVLCAPDMPWEPDPLREHPEERWRLYDRYQAALKELKEVKPISVLSVRGNHDRRLAAVRSTLGLEPL